MIICLVLFVVTNISSVTLLLSLGIFTVTKTLISHMHECTKCNIFAILSGGSEFCICLSSANSFVIKCEPAMEDKSIRYIMRRMSRSNNIDCFHSDREEYH